MTWDEAVAFALSLPDTELSTSYGQPAVKVASNGRAFLNTGHEPDTSFVVAMDVDSIELLKETDRRLIGRSRTTRAMARCWCATTVRTRSVSAK